MGVEPPVGPGRRGDWAQKNRSGSNRAADEGKAGKRNAINGRKRVSAPLQNRRKSRSALYLMLIVEKHVAKVSKFRHSTSGRPDIFRVTGILTQVGAYIIKECATRTGACLQRFANQIVTYTTAFISRAKFLRNGLHFLLIREETG